MKSKKIILAYLGLLLFTVSCDHGLSPGPAQTEPRTGISGTIYYQNWPDSSQLVDLRLVVFENFPPISILEEVLNNRAVVYPPLGGSNLPYSVDSTNYNLSLAPGNYSYIVVAQQFGPTITQDWRSVGQYDTNTDSLPTAITVVRDSLIEHVNIFVDFDDLPIQPF